MVIIHRKCTALVYFGAISLCHDDQETTELYHSYTQLTLFYFNLIFSDSSAVTSSTAPTKDSIELVEGGGNKTPNDTPTATSYHNNGLQTDDEKSQNNGYQDNNANAGARQTDTSATLSWYFKLTWLLQNVAFDAALFVVLLFWIVDFDPAVTNVTVFNVHIHGVNLFLVLVDLFLIASPYRLLHMIYPCTMALVYYLFTIIYYYSGGTNEYSVDEVNGNSVIYKGTLDWENAVTTTSIIMTIVITVVVPLIHLLFFGFYHLRRVSRRCCGCCDGVPA